LAACKVAKKDSICEGLMKFQLGTLGAQVCENTPLSQG